MKMNLYGVSLYILIDFIFQFYMHSDLGKVIQQIIKEMKKNSPAIK